MAKIETQRRSPSQSSPALVEASVGREQYMALTAALLGWLFDGFEMGIFSMVGRQAIIDLVKTSDKGTVGIWFGVITAGFLVGAATGGVLFGWLGDRIGRVRAMTLSILTYALFTGTCGLASNPWQLGVLRFIAALGMGGEWSLGVALVMEIWPDRSRAFMAGLIGAAANAGYLLVGVLGLALNTMLTELALWASDIGVRQDIVDSLVAGRGWRLLMMCGTAPALLTFLIRLFAPNRDVGSASAIKARRAIGPHAICSRSSSARLARRSSFSCGPTARSRTRPRRVWRERPWDWPLRRWVTSIPWCATCRDWAPTTARSTPCAHDCADDIGGGLKRRRALGHVGRGPVGSDLGRRPDPFRDPREGVCADLSGRRRDHRHHPGRARRRLAGPALDVCFDVRKLARLGRMALSVPRRIRRRIFAGDVSFRRLHRVVLRLAAALFARAVSHESAPPRGRDSASISGASWPRSARCRPAILSRRFREKSP